MERRPAVAGRFYSADPRALAGQIDRFLEADDDPVRALGVVVPHAGYIYSGEVAGAVYGRVEIPPRVLVLGPNHTGLGVPEALWPGGGWSTPLGRVPIDTALTAALAAVPGVEPDADAHLGEHSLEVQIPFLQRRRADVAVTALCLGPLSYRDCETLGRAVARAASGAGALVVASSDMSHYLPADVARTRDQRALERILALDPEGLHQVVRRERISMCGFVPATVMLVAAREMGASAAELVRYAHSGEVSGDHHAVVGYAGVIVR